MESMVCPIDGAEAVLEVNINGAGREIFRWVCPNTHWASPWWAAGSALVGRSPLISDTDGGIKVHVTNPSGGEGGPSGGLTNTELRASAVPVSGTFYPATQPVSGTITVANPTTNPETGLAKEVTLASLLTELGQKYEGGAIALDSATLAALESVTATISGTVPVSGTFWPGTQPVSGTVGISGTVPVSGPLTDAQLRATALPVTLLPGGSGLTDSELRASPVPVTAGLNAMTFVSLKSAAPTANSVQADTGALAAGSYDFDINLTVADTVAVGKGLVVEHRNAANSANINVLGGCAPSGSVHHEVRKLTLATNERIRVIAGTAAGAASSMYISAIGRRLS